MLSYVVRSVEKSPQYMRDLASSLLYHSDRGYDAQADAQRFASGSLGAGLLLRTHGLMEAVVSSF